MSDTPITDDVDRIVQLLIANYKTGWINGSECGTRIESEINKLRQLERENAALREQIKNEHKKAMDGAKMWLNAQDAELQEDRERLDWLENNKYVWASRPTRSIRKDIDSVRKKGQP